MYHKSLAINVKGFKIISMKKASFIKSLATLSLTLLVLIGTYFLYNNHQYFLDIYAKSTTPNGSVAETFSKDLSLTSSAELMLYGTYPQVDDKPQFNVDCPSSQNVIELGCFRAGFNDKIYILNINEPSLESMKNVTMAHELLHAAYDRLSTSERQDVNDMVNKQLALLSSDQALQQRLQDYEASEPGSQNNELHSILGTEYKNLLPDLENYYKKYFNDRGKIAQWNTENQSYINEKEQILVNQKSQIESLKSQLSTIESRMQNLKSSGKIAEYNSLVSQQNNLVDQLKSIIETYNNNVAVYNDIINSINSHTYSSYDTNVQ